MLDSIGDLLGGIALLGCGFVILLVAMVGLFFRNRRRAADSLPAQGGLSQGGFGQPRPSSHPVERPQYDDRDIDSAGGFGRPSSSARRDLDRRDPDRDRDRDSGFGPR